MRCGCPECGAYMIQTEGPTPGCVCPQCLLRCSACMGTNSVVSREALGSIVLHSVQEDEQPEEAAPLSGPLRPEDWID